MERTGSRKAKLRVKDHYIDILVSLESFYLDTRRVCEGLSLVATMLVP